MRVVARAVELMIERRAHAHGDTLARTRGSFKSWSLTLQAPAGDRDKLTSHRRALGVYLLPVRRSTNDADNTTSVTAPTKSYSNLYPFLLDFVNHTWES
eukprot:2886292-Amphidinium_carterae.1